MKEFQGAPVEFIETTIVTDGVECDSYKFVGDDAKDLGIIRVAAGKSTPRQKVLNGNHTIEGYASGSGKLVVENSAERESLSVS
ncbi:MAG: hypothetical protein LBM09_00075 [Candidatus Nomurabacteria bacterium]|jgi:hypothetical protein|nr:hypothetical protein [Candidatus Nomurabacteria bacterium]